jgi:hypothetical protein
MRRADNLATFVSQSVHEGGKALTISGQFPRNSGPLNLLEPSVPVLAWNGIALPSLPSEQYR